jgi:3-phenylpropionate/cinnamic acid dioxygenase small subunit
VGAIVSDADHRDVVDFLHLEARLADEARYDEWQALWTDDGVYWVPATTDPTVDPDRQISHIYDNRSRIATRVKLLQTGYRFSQEPASPMRRLVSNIEVTRADDGDLVAESNFLLAELAVQATHALHLWAGRTTHRLRRVDGALRMRLKKVVLINAAEPLPNLSFLI